jgi:hypothetical protein
MPFVPPRFQRSIPSYRLNLHPRGAVPTAVLFVLAGVGGRPEFSEQHCGHCVDDFGVFFLEYTPRLNEF